MTRPVKLRSPRIEIDEWGLRTVDGSDHRVDGGFVRSGPDRRSNPAEESPPLRSPVEPMVGRRMDGDPGPHREKPQIRVSEKSRLRLRMKKRLGRDRPVDRAPNPEQEHAAKRGSLDPAEAAWKRFEGGLTKSGVDPAPRMNVEIEVARRDDEWGIGKSRPDPPRPLRRLGSVIHGRMISPVLLLMTRVIVYIYKIAIRSETIL